MDSLEGLIPRRLSEKEEVSRLPFFHTSVASSFSFRSTDRFVFRPFSSDIHRNLGIAITLWVALAEDRVRGSEARVGKGGTIARGRKPSLFDELA